MAKRGEVPEKVNGEPVRLDRNICEKCTIHPREKWFRFVSTVANVNHAKCKNKTGKHSESIEIKRTNCPRFKFVDTPFGQVPGYPYWLCSYSKLEHLHEMSQHPKWYYSHELLSLLIYGQIRNGFQQFLRIFIFWNVKNKTVGYVWGFARDTMPLAVPMRKSTVRYFVTACSVNAFSLCAAAPSSNVKM